MTQVYQNHGVRFVYPDDWTIAEEAGDGAVSLTVSSPETSFWSMWLLSDRPDPPTMLASAIDVFEDEYDNVDLYRTEGEICEYPALNCDVEFVSMELINSAFVRAFRTGRFSVLILFQGTDHELKQTRAELDAITDSLVCDLGDDLLLG